MQVNRYPKIHILSKNEFAKHISHSRFPKEKARALINGVITNFDKYWKDSKRSDSVSGKFVRSAKGTPLGILLQKVNEMVLGPYDKLIPSFIFGGLEGTNHIKAAAHLLGNKRKRILLKADISRFFEQVSVDRVAQFFQHKCKCSKKAARLLSNLCCVPFGAKGSGSDRKTLARGFATSSRLAVWCNLDIFIKLERLIQKRLRGKDPRIAIYVDDIGITASRVSEKEMDDLYLEIRKLLATADPNQPLPLNDKKKKVISHADGMEHLGIRLYRSRLSIGSKTRSKRDKLKKKLQGKLPIEERNRLRRKYKSLTFYKKHIEAAK